MTDHLKRKNDETRPQQRIVLWSTIYAIVMIIGHHFMILGYGAGPDIFYNFDTHFLFLLILICYAIIGVFGTPILAVIAFILSAVRRNKRYAIAGFIITLSWVWLFGLIIVAGANLPDKLDRIEVNGHAYVIAAYDNYVPDGYVLISLFECRSNDIICEPVFQKLVPQDLQLHAVYENGEVLILTSGTKPDVVMAYQVE